MNKQGSLVVVGTGISPAGQMTILTQSYIKEADIVFMGIMNKIGENVVQKLNPNCHTLDDLYESGKSRGITYTQMKDRIVDAVKQGQRVVAAFYGHPGVFVNPSHSAIEEVQALGLPARMLPGISAEDCLVADLGIDPAHFGCQSYEATQFLFRKYRIDPYMTQIIWQIGLAGEHTHTVLNADHCQNGLQLLTDVLLKHYPQQHQIILYEAATFPVCEPKIEKLSLIDLPSAKPSLISTLVIPALGLPDYDEDKLAKLGLTKEEVIASRKS